MSLLVYVPGLGTPKTIHSLRAVGLESLHDAGLSLNGAEVLRGPDGEAGVVFSWPVGAAIAEGYFPDRQTWHKCAADGDKIEGRAWIGWSGEQPTPAKLARKRQLIGKPLTLNDGGDWLIPIAKALPRVCGLGGNGKVSMQVAKAYEPFFKQSFEMLQRYMANAQEGAEAISWDEAFEYAVTALSLNYRVNRDVVAALGLVTTDLLWTVCESVTEFREIIEALAKKKDAPPKPDESEQPQDSPNI